MRKSKHKDQRRVFTLVLLMEKRFWDLNWEPRLLLGFKTKKLVEKLPESEGFWMPPGGRLEEPDKTLKHCAQREILEETGLFVPLRSMAKVATLNVVRQNGERYAYVHVYMVTKELWDKSDLVCNNGTEMKYIDFYPISKVFSRKFKMLPCDKRWLKHAVEGTHVKVRIVVGDVRTDVQRFSCKKYPRSV